MTKIEGSALINVKWDQQFINTLTDTITKKVSSSVYISKDDASRQVALKSVIGLLSGSFSQGDTVKVTVISDNKDTAEKDLGYVVELLRGDYE